MGGLVATGFARPRARLVGWFPTATVWVTALDARSTLSSRPSAVVA
jgi:hypothetical protein